ncbi:MAG: DNA mismatch repair protein MutL, partial [Lachnospiraceae bacterium]|nr:DNA mismatch repair protein MutL [Lachnospiraceae bacterium]
EAVLDRIASMSCKAAVKGKQTLTTEEAQALMDELMTLDQPYHCPHGRPTMIVMSQYEIEKKFKRIV